MLDASMVYRSAPHEQWPRMERFSVDDMPVFVAEKKEALYAHVCLFVRLPCSLKLDASNPKGTLSSFQQLPLSP
jgi:hypothetical protein